MSQSTAMVMSRRPVHLTTHFPGQADPRRVVVSYKRKFVHILSLISGKNISSISGRKRMTLEIFA